ncbi:hypothetical protein [Streptomyces sp. A0592]|uniref:hypothetical protein n=1 Tax=Streptomyces sp. A0592 TaxID=2563099 RepID=UPI00109EBB64|nr:hypothetical protein [Streptomyces sp. A0592]THA80084.1 hypothetical protein E6U81_30240 [Streptomyces sp. A0592]
MQNHAKARSNATEDARSTVRRPVTTPPAQASGLLGLQATVGNAVVVQRLKQQHRHGAGCGHEAEGAPVQRSAVHDVVRAGGRSLDGSTRADMESGTADVGGWILLGAAVPLVLALAYPGRGATSQP